MSLRSFLAFTAAGVIAVGLFVLVRNTSKDSKMHIPGDVNGDGQINSVDASAVLAEYSAISGNKPASFTKEQNDAADINKDGKTDAVDASQILSYYSHLSTGGNLSIDDFLHKSD